MRNTEKALLHRITKVAEICREHNVACLANGDAQDYSDGLRIMEAYKVDGVMIARAAETNPSCFRPQGKLPSIDVAREFLSKVSTHVAETYCRLLNLIIIYPILNSV